MISSGQIPAGCGETGDAGAFWKKQSWQVWSCVSPGAGSVLGVVTGELNHSPRYQRFGGKQGGFRSLVSS